MNWPGFSTIANAWWLLLLIPLLVVYFLKLKRSRLEVTSLALWQSVINDQRVNSPFQKFRRNILLWLQIAILLLLVLAAMQPYLTGAAERATYLPILIDCSASMAAIDPQTGQSRLDVAKQQVTELIENQLPGQQLVLIAAHTTADQLTEFTGNRRILLDALGSLRVREVPGHLEEALRMTQALAKTVPVESAVLYSDGNFPERVRFALPFRVNYQLLPSAGSNAGITAFNARLASSRDWDVFLRVESSGDVTGQLELLHDGKAIGKQPFVLGRDESQRLTFRVESATSTSLEARLTIDRSSFDSLSCDNVAWLDLPAARPLRVFASPGLASFRHALTAMPGIDVFPRDNQLPQRSVPYDLVISDQAADESLIASVHLLVGVTPEDAAGLVEHASGLTRFLDWDRTSPLLRHVQLRDVEIADSVQPAAGINGGSFEERGYSILASGLNGPLIISKRSGSQQRFYLLFHTNRSTLEFRVAFPVLVANVAQLARQEASLGDVRSLQAGVLPPIKLKPDTEYVVTGPDRTTQQIRSDTTGEAAGITAGLAGRYFVTRDGLAELSVAANLLSTEETTLRAVDTIQFDEQSVSSSTQLLENDRPLWSTLTLLAFVGLLVEWWYFQRPSRLALARRSR
ncbi:MAG: VWA domain-containing protein [Planctomycetota bacterium]|nr:VWA domain-containing protein [Planctomycetota bacterium]